MAHNIKAVTKSNYSKEIESTDVGNFTIVSVSFKKV